MRGNHALDDRLEQRLLGLEIEIGQALADAGAGGDILEPGAGIALGGEFLDRRRYDLLRAGIAAPLAPLGFRTSSLSQRFLSSHVSALLTSLNIMTDWSVLQ